MSNDSYGTVVNMGLDGDGASPGGGGSGGNSGPPRGYLGATTPPYHLSTSRSPSLPPQFSYPPDAGLSVYTTLGKCLANLLTLEFHFERLKFDNSWYSGVSTSADFASERKIRKIRLMQT